VSTGPLPRIRDVVSCYKCGLELPIGSGEIRPLQGYGMWECYDESACMDRQIENRHEPLPGEMGN
jgi:hypothetical protein